jgi:hypothetical protein
MGSKVAFTKLTAHSLSAGTIKTSFDDTIGSPAMWAR